MNLSCVATCQFPGILQVNNMDHCLASYLTLPDDVFKDPELFTPYIFGSFAVSSHSFVGEETFVQCGHLQYSNNAKRPQNLSGFHGVDVFLVQECQTL